MEEGAVGFSTGLSYYPQAFSDTAEIVELCRPVAARGGVYVTHIRTVFRGEPFDPVIETLDIGRQSGVAVHFSHFRTDPTNVGRPDLLMAAIDGPQADGVDVTLDTYPYPSGAGFGLAFLPPWASEGGPDALLDRLRDPAQRARIVQAMVQARTELRTSSWAQRVYSYLPHNPDLEGVDFVEAARRRGASSPEELLCDLLLQEELAVGNTQAPPEPVVADQIERDIMSLFQRPNYMVGSDSISIGGVPHPRAYGTFPRLLGRYRREIGGLSLEALVNRATAVAADRFHLKDRGRLLPGKAADVVVFDPDTLVDTATYQDPHQYPLGIRYVLVNGQVAVEGGKPTGVLAGRALP
jgi:N-acyl-D-amino-acid deacylase